MTQKVETGGGNLGRRRRRELRTVRAMLEIYCRGRHRKKVDDCPECAELRDYAERRLVCCVFGEGKPTCQRCPVHCYKPRMREKIIAVMRYAGPRMLLRHPYWAIRHLLDGWKPVPKEFPPRRQTGSGDF